MPKSAMRVRPKSKPLPRSRSKLRRFPAGAGVEVRYRGAWYAATALRSLPSRRRHYVLYSTLLDDSDPASPYRESVRDSILRPSHPGAPGPPFCAGQVVEVFWQKGWWSGVVIDNGGDRYRVRFRAYGKEEEEEFGELEVRARLRWVKGKWIEGEEGNRNFSVPRRKRTSKASGGPIVPVSISASSDNDDDDGHMDGGGDSPDMGSGPSVLEQQKKRKFNFDDQDGDHHVRAKVVAHMGGIFPTNGREDGFRIKQIEISTGVTFESGERRENAELFNMSLVGCSLKDVQLPCTEKNKMEHEESTIHSAGVARAEDGNKERQEVFDSCTSLHYEIENVLAKCSKDLPQKEGVETHEMEIPRDLAVLSLERMKAAENENCPTFNDGDAQVKKNTKLPFEKKMSLVWQTLQSMDIFHAMPQKPHFQPLENFCQELCEGMAIGLMVSFASLASSICNIRITDPLSTFQEKLQALVPLEENGFGVQHLRSRIEQLLQVKNNYSISEVKKAALEGNFLDCSNEKERLNAVVTTLDKSIMELEEKIASLQEERTSAITQGKIIDCNIVGIRMDLHKVEESYELAKGDFAATLAAPW